MTIPSFMGLQTALSGLVANQAAIDTTGHNIANANTPGYSRQSANLVESASLTIPAFSSYDGAGVQFGTGVTVNDISRVRDQFLDIQYRAQNSQAGGANAESAALANAQTALNESGTSGISTQLQTFWKSWNGVANAPQSPAARQSLLGAAQTLTQSFNTLDGQLATLQSQAGQQYGILTGPSGQVATDATQIATLNAAISQAKVAGQTPNDLMDQRDQLIDNLSSLASVSVTDQGNGAVAVQFGDAATPLVSGTTVTWPQTLTSAAGGQLGALQGLTASTGKLAGYRSALDAVAASLASSVNALQPSSPFFSGTTAGSIAVVATASSIQTTTTTSAGANDLALKIAGLQGGPVDQSYTSFVAQIGGDVASAQSAQGNAQSLLTALNNQRQSVSGVSLDEEMTNLLTYQRGYQASARMMTTIDSMLDTLINHTGRSGL